MTMIEVKTAELIGPALDYCVALTEQEERAKKGHRLAFWKFDGEEAFVGFNVPRNYGLAKSGVMRRKYEPHQFSPSTKWADGGLLIDKYDAVIDINHDGRFYSETQVCPFGKGWASEDEGRLVAVCRAIVSAKFGDVVMVPAELVSA